MFEEEAKLKGITIKFKNQLDEQYDIEVDGNRLLGVLVHIISNSLKFTSSGSIMITLSKEIEMLTSSLQVVRKLYSYNSIDSKSRANRKGNNAFQVKNIQPVQ
jgi:DNA topoisomerase VI subunit B